MIPFHDIADNVVGGVSIKPGTTASANGDWIDMDKSIGSVNGALQLGSATGTPTSYTASVKLQEADDNSGTGVQDMAGANASASLAGAAPAVNDKQVIYCYSALRSKRWVRLVSTITHTGGSSPALDHAGLLQALKART